MWRADTLSNNRTGKTDPTVGPGEHLPKRKDLFTLATHFDHIWGVRFASQVIDETRQVKAMKLLMRKSGSADPEIGAPEEEPVKQALELNQIGRWSTRTRRLTWPVRNLWLDVQLENETNVPANGPVVLAANHLSFMDSPLLMYCLPRRVTFLGKAEYLNSWSTRKLFPAAGMIPVDRSGKGMVRSLAMAQARLEAGEAVGIFPEGSRSRNGRLHRGRTGVAHLALCSGAPIVPVGISGTDAIQPAGRLVPRFRGKATLRFGAPIGLGRWAGKPRSSEVKREITDEVMAAIQALSGQETVGDFLPLTRATG